MAALFPRRAACIGGALILSVMVACGGGSSSSIQIAAPGVVGTGPAEISVGSINGFGSIVVNGVHFDERTSTVTDEDQNTYTPQDLKLGMVVEVRSDAVSGATGTAQSVRIVSQLRGGVDSVDMANQELQMLGWTVEIDSDTVFDNLAGIADVHAGDLLQVFGFYNYHFQTIEAMRVTRLSALPAAGMTLRGIVSVPDAAAKTFKIGDLTIDYRNAALAQLSSGPDVGMLVRVNGAAPVRNVMQASRVEGVTVDLSGIDFATVNGIVSDFQSQASFKVEGMAVDGSQARLIGTTHGTLGGGARVALYGNVVGGVIRAELITIYPNTTVTTSSSFTLSGPIGSFVSASSFKVRGMTIDASQAAFSGGTAQNLADSLQVTVTGPLQNSPSGTVLKAMQVTF